MRRLVLLLLGGSLLTACVTDGTGGSMLETAASYDPTGLAGSAVAYGSMAAAMAGAVNRTDEVAMAKAEEDAVAEAELAAAAGIDVTAEPVALEDVDLKLIGSRLLDVADGRITGPERPDLMGPVALGMMREHGMQVAQTMLVGSLTGGANLVGNLPALAEGGMSIARTAQAQQRINDAYEKAAKARAETAVVPDADRPDEAKALLSIMDGPPGRPAEWDNDATGAAGRVIVTRDLPMDGGISCRLVQREWRGAEDFRSGEAAICRQGADWYQLG